MPLSERVATLIVALGLESISNNCTVSSGKSTLAAVYSSHQDDVERGEDQKRQHRVNHQVSHAPVCHPASWLVALDLKAEELVGTVR